MKRGIFGGVGLIIVAVAAFLVFLSVYIVDPTEQALVLRLGQPISVKSDPGMYFKLPLIENTVYIEKWLLDLESRPQEVIASDQKRLVVDAFGRYRVTDPLLFYQAVHSVASANIQLSSILDSAVRRVLGAATFLDVVRDKRQPLMAQITSQVNSEARQFGVEVVDVKIRAADLPDANSQAIYQRMITERQRQATELRAQGQQQAQRIRAEADRSATVIVAEANKTSEQLRGDGDAAVNKISADAFTVDPEFFAFYRSMQAYQAGLRSDNTRLVVSPESDFFNYFKDPMGKIPGAAAAAAPPAGPGTPPRSVATP